MVIFKFYYFFIKFIRTAHIIIWKNSFFVSSSGRLPASLSRLELINWKLSRSTKCCPNMKAMYFPFFFGITFISSSFSSPFLLFYVCFLAISPISYIMKWLSYHRKLWKTVGTLIFSAFNLKCWHNNVDEPIIFIFQLCDNDLSL